MKGGKQSIAWEKNKDPVNENSDGKDFKVENDNEITLLTFFKANQEGQEGNGYMFWKRTQDS